MNIFDKTIAGNIVRLNRENAEMGDIAAQKVIFVANLWLELLEKDVVSCDELSLLLKKANDVKDLKLLSHDMYDSILGWHYESCILPNLPTKIEYDLAPSADCETYLILAPIEETFTLRTHHRFAKVVVLLEPYLADKYFQIEWKVGENKIPKKFMEAVFQGIREASLEEFRENKRVLHLKISIIDGGFHETDSIEEAYRKAAYSAYKNAIAGAEIEKL